MFFDLDACAGTFYKVSVSLGCPIDCGVLVMMTNVPRTRYDKG